MKSANLRQNGGWTDLFADDANNGDSLPAQTRSWDVLYPMQILQQNVPAAAVPVSAPAPVANAAIAAIASSPAAADLTPAPAAAVSRQRPS